MAAICKVSSTSIRGWLKKHEIKWRSISESLLIQSDKVSERAKKAWADEQLRKRHSDKMKEVQSERKDQLSKSAKLNWSQNRTKIIDGIRRTANDPKRLAKLSEAGKKNWENSEYRDKITENTKRLWADEGYRSRTIKAIQKACQTEEFSKLISDRFKDPAYAERIKQSNILRWLSHEYAHNMALQSRRLWNDSNYIAKQESVREQRNVKISQKMKDIWGDISYRSKYATGIDIQSFLSTSLLKFGDQFDYTNTQFFDWKTKINVFCSQCSNEIVIHPQTHIKLGYCRYCQTSFGQRELYEMASQYYESVVNDRQVIGPLELDVYVPERKLAIEHHGLYWHSYDYLEDRSEKYRHQHKWEKCVEKGIKLLQFFDFELTEKKDIVESMISARLGKSSKILYARKLKIAYMDNLSSKNFFDINHLQGHRHASITIGLFEDDKVLMAASFSPLGSSYEIIRMAAAINTTVVGGVSKLISFFINNHNPASITTFADLRYSTGEGYIKSGFKLLSITKPNYFYYKGNQKLSRHQCQKHRLEKLLSDGFDPQLSESANMFNNGFRRVWDAGSYKLILIP